MEAEAQHFKELRGATPNRFWQVYLSAWDTVGHGALRLCKTHVQQAQSLAVAASTFQSGLLTDLRVLIATYAG